MPCCEAEGHVATEEFGSATEEGEENEYWASQAMFSLLTCAIFLENCQGINAHLYAEFRFFLST